MTCIDTPGKSEDQAAQIERALMRIVQTEFQREEVAVQIARVIADGMRREYGGEAVYIPSANNRARDERIRREFCGASSVPAIQRWSGLSRTSIYRIAAGKNPVPPLQMGRAPE